MPDKEKLDDQTQVLAQIGTLLRETRENKGLTLEAAQEETKIRRYYLEALEQGKKHLLPGEVYLKGFLKNYACFLGLPGEELVKRYSQSRQEYDDNTLKSEPIRPWRIPSQSNSYRRVFMLAILLVLLVAVSLVLTRGMFSPDSRFKEPSYVENQLPVPSSPDDIVYDEPEPEESHEDHVQVILDTPDEIIYQVDSPPHVEITVTDDRCWIAIRTDDSGEVSETLAAGTNRIFIADSQIWFRAGNPSVLDLTINGVHIGKAGKSGQPRNITVKQ